MTDDQSSVAHAGNGDVNERGARIPSVGDQFRQRDLGIMGDAAQCANEIVLFEERSCRCVCLFFALAMDCLLRSFEFAR